MSHLLPLMCRQGNGRVINIGGNHGRRGRTGRASYASSKRVLEVGKHGVTANRVAPGAIVVDRMRPRWADQAEVEGISEAIVLERYVQSLGVALQRPSESRRRGGSRTLPGERRWDATSPARRSGWKAA